MGTVKRAQRDEGPRRGDGPSRVEQPEAPGLADESLGSSRRAGAEPKPREEDPVERARVATTRPDPRRPKA